MTIQTKDDDYWNAVDKVNLLVEKGYIEEEDFHRVLKDLLEKQKDINSKDRQERDGNP